MSKGNKINLKNAKLNEHNGELLAVEYDEIDTTLELEKINIVEQLKKFENTDRVKIIVKESKPKNPKPRATQYKFECGCGCQIKSKEENLEIKCLKCNKQFEIVE